MHSIMVGKRLRPLTKHSRKKIRELSSDVFALWKKVVLEQTNSDKKNGTVEETVKVEKIDQNGTPRPVEVLQSETVATSPVLQARMESIPKCNDALRDRMYEQLYEALCKVSSEAKDEIWDKVKACDPIQVAVSVESVLFQNWGHSNGSHKIKHRSLMFNIKYAKNPDFQRKILLETRESRENCMHELRRDGKLASDERQQKNETIKQKALFNCEVGGALKATTDQFKCGRCGQRKTTYHQMQTRSADEPMTTYVTCVNCNNHWKFC
ncbi:hypothetical protein JCGZ_03305 [Jatropha curcas]|uniref:TFIIS central domain-containing protein n=1 Tax=Jatropha curcas TaxID=180498 RepID=A0A067JQ41_JATCU|nr:hypothetical protein JCGZ_03305 [Jatropha curcas]